MHILELMLLLQIFDFCNQLKLLQLLVEIVAGELICSEAVDILVLVFSNEVVDF